MLEGRRFPDGVEQDEIILAAGRDAVDDDVGDALMCEAELATFSAASRLAVQIANSSRYNTRKAMESRMVYFSLK